MHGCMRDCKRWSYFEYILFNFVTQKTHALMQKSEDIPTGLKDSVAVKYISHFRGQLKNSIFLDQSTPNETKLVYPAANTIAFNMLSASFQNEKTQSFIPALLGSRGITCMAQSQNKKYLAWAEETEAAPIIFLIDLTDPTQKRKSFASAQVKSKKFTCLTFNGNQITDPKFLVALTSGPEYQILQWNFEKGKFFIHSLDKNQKTTATNTTLINGPQKFSQIFFYREQDTIVAMGKENLKFYKLTPQKLILKDSPFARKEINEKDYNFTAYCVMKDSLIIGTESGELLYFSVNGEFKAVIVGSPGKTYTIQALAYLPNSNKAFLVGGSEGMLIMYEKTESKDPKNIYVRSDRKFPLKEFRGRITSLTPTPKQNDIFIGFHSGLILKMTLEKNQESTVDYALQSFHTDSITGLDISLRKSLVATCSADRTVRVWNYLQKNTLEVIKQFEQKPLSLSFHPSGQHLVVSFPDKVRLINIQENQLVSFKDLPIKNCYEVKFSNGGHLFAVVNNVMVQLFNFYTLDQAPQYQFKAVAGKFQAMCWDQDDLAVFLGTSDGFVYYNKIEDQSVRLTILSVPGLSIKTIASIFVGKDEKQGLINERTVYASGVFSNNVDDENKCIYEVKITPRTEKDKERQSFRDELSKYNVSTPTKIYTYCNVSKISFLNSKKVFLYTANKKQGSGSIRYCKYPLNSSKQIYQIQTHTKPINKILVSCDDNYIFSAGEEGELICYQFRDKDSKIKIEMPDLSEEFLYSKTKLMEHKNMLEDLKNKNLEAKDKRDRAMRETKAQSQRLIKQWSLKISDRQKSQNAKYQKQTQLLAQMTTQQKKKLDRLEIEHREKRDAVEKDYANKIHLEQTRFSELTKTKVAEKVKFQQILETLEINHIKTKQKREVQFNQQLKKQIQELAKHEQNLKKLENHYKQLQQKQQDQAEDQIKVKKQVNQGVIKDLTKDNEKAESQKRAKKQIYEKQQRQLEEQNHKLKHTHEDIEKIKQKHEENLQKKQSQAKQIQEREKTIRDKMTRINELKKKTQQLQKFKFVLDYKIKQLKRDIGPRQQEISKMKQQIANMNSQIIHFKRTNDNMQLIVKDLVSKRNGMETEAKLLTDTETKNLSYIKSFEYDVSELYQNCINDYKELKKRVVELYRKYVQEEGKKKMDGIDQQKEFIKERAHLESTVKGLKQKFKKSIQLHENDHKRIMGQNEQLISEINDLKRQKKNLKDDAHKQELLKQIAIKLEEQRQLIDRQYENTEKTLRQLKTQYEKKVRRKKEEVEA